MVFVNVMGMFGDFSMVWKKTQQIYPRLLQYLCHVRIYATT